MRSSSFSLQAIDFEATATRCWIPGAPSADLAAPIATPAGLAAAAAAAAAALRPQGAPAEAFGALPLPDPLGIPAGPRVRGTAGSRVRGPALAGRGGGSSAKLAIIRVALALKIIRITPLFCQSVCRY
eukprot:CAMPEP_0194577982 /NCGR_PEP_ID=MMETSP0292-20121207/12558_1 /TAXON_ID=39354 /ORGANISM="Heterosigma akashiwo, Strain CCMP2393" /LENGTH=127 /DNA_ID=CAMNT_0039430497 /DNA_START=396 /DNA_END=780 /DNA_ORIENTATION=+